jgi:RHS repeat-associated protein
MQLSSGSHIPDGLLAANALLSEKPRLGVPTWNPAPHQGISEANCTAAIGLRASESLNRVWPRYTGKERDAESGLDYFGARYYGSNMGRFMSPDWSAQAEPVPYAKLSDPQSLNLYGYMGNNPLGGVDADGHCCQWLSNFGTGLANSTYRPLVQAVEHPITTLKGLGTAIEHPIATAEGAWGGIKSTSVSVMQGDGTAIGTAVGSAAMLFVPGGEEAEAGEGLSRLSLLSDDANVVRGGLPGNIANGTGVSVGADGTLSVVSVQSANGASVADLSTGIPHNQVSVTTVGDVRAAGGDVVPSPNAGNPNHCTMCGVTPQQAKDIMKTIPNPSKNP